MKRIFVITGFILITVLPAAGTFHDKSFWVERAKKLSADRASLSSSGALDARLASLIDGEIARAERMTAADDGSSGRSGPRSVKTISAADAYAAYLLRETVNGLPSASEESRVLNMLRSDIEKLFESKGITPDKKFMSAFMARVTPFERSLIALECGAAARARSLKSPAADGLPPDNLTLAEIQKHYSDNPLKAPAPEDMRYDDSVIAKALVREADAYADALNEAREFLGSKGLIADASTLSQSAAKTGEMGKSAFTRLSVKLIDSTCFDRRGLKPGADIPAEPDMHAIFGEIDRIRDESVSSKKIDSSALSEADRGMRAAISRGTAASADALFSADEKSAINDGVKAKTAASTCNDESIARSKEILRAKILKAHEYREANLRFIRLSEKLNSVSEKNRIRASYSDRIKSLRAISSFITDLDTRIRHTGSSDLNTMRHALIPRVKTFLETLNSFSAIPDSERIHLGKNGLKPALELRGEFSKEIQSAIGSLRAAGTTTKQEAVVPSVSSLQDDENALADSIRAWTSEINRARRMDPLLAEYSSFFGECEKDAKEGILTERLAKVLENRSLLNPLGAAFAQKIRDEDIRHTFLAGWLKGDLARLNAVHSADTNGLMPVKSLSDDEMKAAKEALTPHSPVKIAAWNLTPANIARTDANAAAYLAKLFARVSAQKGNVPVRNVTLADAQYAFSIDIPRHYEDAAPSAHMRMHAVMRGVYTDLPRASTIHFLVVPNNFKGTRSVLEEFVGSVNMRIVKWKDSGARDSGSCTVIGSGNGDVIEASAVERGGMIVIIAGTSPKNRYGTLSAALRNANDTLKSAIGE